MLSSLDIEASWLTGSYDTRTEAPWRLQAVSALAELGEPPEAVELLTYLFTEVLDGRNAHLGDGVQRALAP